MPVVIERQRSEGVLELSINRPNKRNALNQEVVERLTAAFTKARERKDVRAIVLSAEGGVFSAGADLASLQALQTATRAENERDSGLLATLFEAIIVHSKPVIARVHGHAIAGGCGLVAACDFAIGAREAKLGFTEVKIGFVPAIVAAIVANKLRGNDLRLLMLAGRLVSGGEAERIGLLTRAVEAERLDAEVDDLADRLCEVSGEAVAMTKQLLASIPGLTLEEALQKGRQVNVEARQSADCREGIASFLEKRDPSWSRRRRGR